MQIETIIWKDMQRIKLDLFFFLQTIHWFNTAT